MTEAEGNKRQRSLRGLREGALGVLSGAEAELLRVTGKLLDGMGVTGGRGEGQAPARIREAVHELVDRARQRREELERLVDDGVKAAAARVGRPISDELQSLRGRLEKVQQRVDRLARRGGRK